MSITEGLMPLLLTLAFMYTAAMIVKVSSVLYTRGHVGGMMFQQMFLKCVKFAVRVTILIRTTIFAFKLVFPPLHSVYTHLM